MSDPVSSTTSPPATDVDGKLLLAPEQARALLHECFATFQSGLIDVVATSIDGTNDLFEQNKFVTDVEVADFRSKRPEWLKHFEQSLQELFEKRLAGNRRSGRRPDADRSLASLRVLNAFDHEKQSALVTATQFLHRLTKRELDALDLRVGVLLGETLTREIDNPFAPDYILDAIGMTSRTLLPNPRVWRPLMERVLADITPAAPKTYIRLNRLLADRHVLPEIKAVAPPELAVDLAVPAASAGTGALPSSSLPGAAPASTMSPASTANAAPVSAFGTGALA